MQKIDFKNYILNKITDLTKEYRNIEEQLTKLTNPNDIDLDNYGSRKKLIELYKSHIKKHFLQKLISPSTNELKNFIYNYERHILLNQKSKIEKQIIILKSASNSLVNNEFIKEFTYNYSPKYLLKTILDYSEKENVNAKEIVDLIISLFRRVPTTESVENQLEINLANSFDNHNYPKKNVRCEEIIFNFKKLLTSIFGEEIPVKYTVTINDIIKEIQLRYQKINSSLGKKEILLESQKALQNLKPYIEGNKIIKSTSDLEGFKRDLQNSGLEASIINEYIIGMEAKIAEEKEAKRIAEDERLLKKYLSDEYLDVINEARLLLKELSSEALDNLIARSINDVISLCRYLEIIGDETQEYLDVEERITAKITILQSELKKPITTKSSFNYYINNEGIPNILRNLDAIDVIFYKEAYSLLNYLSINHEAGVTLTKIDNLYICEITGQELTLKFAKKGNNIVIIGIRRKSEIAKELTIDDINNIKMSLSNTKENQIFQKKCEETVLSALNLYSPEVPYSLHK